VRGRLASRSTDIKIAQSSTLTMSLRAIRQLIP